MNVLSKSTHLLSLQSDISDMFIIQLQRIIPFIMFRKQYLLQQDIGHFIRILTNRGKK